MRLVYRIGVAFHLLNRVIEKLVGYYWGWSLKSYIQAKAARCGSVFLAGYGRFAHVAELEIGDNVHINVGAYWVCEGGVSIGDNTIFAKNVTIYARNHNYGGDELPFDHTNLYRPVAIGRNVWVGANVTILPGARIGDGAIIGAGAVVAGEVPDGAIFVAQKAGQIGSRDMEHYRRLDEAKAYHNPIYFA
ncbi:acetyltransferase-like isoleucine patch superfamily enzyme [Sphingopyxis panaciterrae]|uniref:acyltransferase n=1 Tax=Sphingopyxis panaciterrae TaxID=363841 RepID=UPI001ABA998F|nr:acyltransferase [Sphingopyxis panaciterrae]NIJ36411.1 acetyltransferase-like isoleucine patch superfamily enzyme [Sphingopyxis panaciterrae]